jgi:hypothetical protein
MASVAPEVKITCRERVPKNSATCSRASSNATLAIRPSVWIRPGSAALIQGSMASTAAGRTGDVDAWSR